MKTKTQFKHYKNLPPKKDNKKAKRILLLLIITIIVSFVLTISNTLALFVHVFNDKKQDNLSITTAEQYNAPPNYEYSERSLIYYLDGIGNVGDETAGAFANYFMVALYDDRVDLLYFDTTIGSNGNINSLATLTLKRVEQWQGSYIEAGGEAIFQNYVYAPTDYANGFITSGASLDYIRYSIGRRTVDDVEFNVLVTLGLAWPNSPIYEYYIYFYFDVQSSQMHLTYGEFYDYTDNEEGEFTVRFTDTNPCILINPTQLRDIIESSSNDYIIELRRQIQELQNSTNQQIQNAYNQGRNDGEDIGYNNGYNDGLNDANTYTFSNVIGSLIDGPVNAVMALFDFEVLGVNLRGFFLSLITCAVVIAIIKIFM